MPPRNLFTWRHQYDTLRDAEERAATDIDMSEEVSMTKQSFAKQVDLNTIAARFNITDGAIPPQAGDPRYFGDFTDSVDLQTALNRVQEATRAFNALPAGLRAQFDNDPVLLHAWVSDPENLEEAVKLGLLRKPVAEIPTTEPGPKAPDPKTP